MLKFEYFSRCYVILELLSVIFLTVSVCITLWLFEVNIIYQQGLSLRAIWAKYSP